MTKVGQLFEEERMASIQAERLKFAEALLKEGMDVKFIVRTTNLSIEEVEEVQKRLFAIVK